jgi:hypothetical protein
MALFIGIMNVFLENVKVLNDDEDLYNHKGKIFYIMYSYFHVMF